MSGWRRIPVKGFCERATGFSVPQDDVVLVISESVNVMHLGDEITVYEDEDFFTDEIYDWETGVARHRGKEYQIIGRDGGRPLLDGPNGERLVLDTDAMTLSVVRRGEVV